MFGIKDKLKSSHLLRNNMVITVTYAGLWELIQTDRVSWQLPTPRMCCSFRLCRIGPLPPAKAFPGEWMFFSYEDDFGSLHFEEHPSVVPLYD